MRYILILIKSELYIVQGAFEVEMDRENDILSAEGSFYGACGESWCTDLGKHCDRECSYSAEGVFFTITANISQN
ncbi:MAG TPA: hypothetical protein ENK25_07945 [Bacteroidetes bacterium]|nr:hypothetical protein [Bacteroidota bacterium]